jgi:hypothetical protein
VPDLNTLLDDHVQLAYESVDRNFLNGYVAKLQEPDQLAWFLGQHQGEELPRNELLGRMTRGSRPPSRSWPRTGASRSSTSGRASAKRRLPSPISLRLPRLGTRVWS